MTSSQASSQCSEGGDIFHLNLFMSSSVVAAVDCCGGCGDRGGQFVRERFQGVGSLLRTNDR